MRGDLGPLTVWTTPDTIRDKHESQEEWKLLYSGERPPSPSPSLALTRPRPDPPSPSPALALTFTLALAPTLGLTFEPNRSPSPKPEQVHPASRNEMVELKFTEPVKLRPGQSCGLYVHSALPGDEAIVYDNQRSRFTYQDRCFKVMPGLAHLSNKPFGKRGF